MPTPGTARRVPIIYRPLKLIKSIAIFLLVLSGLFFLNPVLGGQTEKEIQEKKKQIKDIERQIKQERDKVRQAEEKEQSVLTQLYELENQLEVKEKELKILKSRLSQTNRRIVTLQGEIEEVSPRLERSQTLLKKRLRAIYKQGQWGYLRLLFSSPNYAEMARRAKYLTLIARQDRRITENYNRNLGLLVSSRQELLGQKQTQVSSREQAERQQRFIREDQQKRKTILSSIRREKGLHQRTIRDLERAQQDLQALVEGLRTGREGKQAKPSTPPYEGKGVFGRMKGHLEWPVSGPVTSFFGKQQHPRFRIQMQNKGITIKAPQGKDIRAVADGRVIYADWFKGYGKIIIVDHGDGYYTLYAHASEIMAAVGQNISRGQIIGQVGETGSLDGPNLYFEVRQNGRPQDPLAWLAPK